MARAEDGWMDDHISFPVALVSLQSMTRLGLSLAARCTWMVMLLDIFVLSSGFRQFGRGRDFGLSRGFP